MSETDASRPAPPHILVVDDDPAVRQLLRECFEIDGYVVTEAENGRKLQACLAEGRVHLITLDIGLGGENGFDIARQVRAVTNIPIVMISGKDDMIDRVVGLELGADDYITKPFHVREVQARVRAVLRRYEAGQPALMGVAGSANSGGSEGGASRAGEQFAFGEWTLDTVGRSLHSARGRVQELTTAEYNLLEMFVSRPGRVLSRDNIMDLLKGHDWSPFDRSIDALIVRLRRKIEPDHETPKIIKTVRGIGYVLAVEVKRV